MLLIPLGSNDTISKNLASGFAACPEALRGGLTSFEIVSAQVSSRPIPDPPGPPKAGSEMEMVYL